MMKNFFRTLLLSAAFGSVSFLAISQPQHVTDHVKKLMPTPVPQSPNVAGLGKYGDYQVNHFNGIPDISIPIFEAKSGGLSVPLTLSYHASGVKPTDVSGWVGMGWSLSAGGEVSRNVQGKPDEQHYYGNALKQNVAVCGPPGTGTYYYLKDIVGNAIDTEPDIFSYSMPGQGGKFLLPNGAAPIMFPYAPIVLNTTSGFGKFEITDQQGVLHRFGLNGSGSKLAQDVTLATNGGNVSVSGVTAWHLMEMIAPNSNDLITFDYQSLGSSSTHDISYAYTVMDQCHTANGGTCPLPYYVLQQSNNDSNITQMGLQTITFENGKVEFELTTNRSDVPSLKRLERIKVYSTVNGVEALQKTIQFNYSYFTNAVAGSQALKLDGVQFLDKASVSVQNYTFTYFTNSFSWTPNAVNFLNARDLWGYYNGATSNTDLIIPQSIPFQQTDSSPLTNMNVGGALDRNVNPLYIKEGVLKRINFPTGGYTEFDFESNKYDKSGVTTNSGGLRVSKISSSDGSAAPPIVKIYRYGNAESGLGLPNFLDNEFNYYSSTLYFSDCGTQSPITNYQTRTYFSHSFGGESPIMYPYVTEYLGDPAGTTNGKTIYIYDGGSPSYDATNTMPGSSKIYKNSFSWKRGKLTSKTVYDNANKIISSTAISRSLFQSANNFVGWSVYQFITGTNSPICTGSGNGCSNEASESVDNRTYKFGSIYQSSGVLVETGVTETTYQDGDINKLITKTQSKTVHTDKLQVIQSTQGTSVSSEQLVTVNRYPFDFATVNASSTGAAKGIYKLNQKNILSTPLETYTYQDLSGVKSVTSAQVTTFRENSSNTNYVVPDQIFLWESAAPVAIGSYSVMTIIGNSSVLLDSKLAQRINMVSYDEVGNIQTVSKVNDAPVAYLYGYNKTMPVAEVVNAQNSSFSNIQNVSTSSISMNGPTPSVTGNTTFTVAYTGNVYLKLGVSGNPTYSTLASYSGIGSGSVTLGKNACGITTVTFTNVAPGTYTITVILTTPDSGVSNLGACGQVEYPGPVVSGGVNESFYDNFEDKPLGGPIQNSLVAHTGSQYYSGTANSYTPFPIPNGRTYVAEYWYYDTPSGKWIYKFIQYTGVALAEAILDDVRVYPKDAQMKSYTYSPLFGMTSSINENGLTYTYEYDTFGRLLLVRDHNGKIEKQYSYRYKSN